MKLQPLQVAVATAALVLPMAAQAQNPAETEILTIATATSNVNIRSGPGPEHPIIGQIKDGRRANVLGCVEGSLWCEVDHRGIRGWAYSRYMILDAGSRRLVVTEPVVTEPLRPAPRVVYDAPSPGIALPPTPYLRPAPVATYRPSVTTVVETTGAAPRDVSGALLAPQSSPTVYAATTPPPTVGRYVASNPGDPVYLEGDVVVGAGLPQEVMLRDVPDYRYQYVWVNDTPVLVDPMTRRIVYVFR